MKYLLNLLALIILIYGNADSQEAVYSVTNYTTREYGRGFHPTNLAVIQDYRGIIYAANGFKMLEYDGTSWKSYPINKETWILSLAADKKGIIYAGSQNEFGYFAPDKRGELIYHSLCDSLKIEDLDFTNIWRVHTFSGGTIFQAEEKIFLYSNGRIEIIRPETSFHTSFIVNDKFYVREREKGLMVLNEKKLELVPGSEIFDTTGVFMMLPLGKNTRRVLAGTRDKGFWTFDPAQNHSSFRKFMIEDEKMIRDAIITSGSITGDGLIAVSTMLDGVIVIDSSGRTRTVINTSNGLSDNDVKNIITDQTGNLWTALNNGLSRIDISSPVSVLDEKSGLKGSITSLIRFNDLLYTGTNTGLLVQDRLVKTGSSFISVAGIPVPVRSLANPAGSLFAGTDAGLYVIKGTEAFRIGNEESYVLYYSPGLKLLFSGGPKGLSTWASNGSTAVKINSIKIEGEDIIGITEISRSGSDISELWLGTRYKGIIRLHIRKDLSFTTESYGDKDGIPPGAVIPAILNSELVIQTIEGIYAFTDEKTVMESLPDSLKNKKDFVKGFFHPIGEINRNIGRSVTFLSEKMDKVWICSDNIAGYLDKKDSMRHVTRPFLGIDAGKIFTIYPEENGMCWIGTSDGLIRYDGNKIKDYEQKYLSLIRRITLIDNDSVIYMGSGDLTGGLPDIPYRFNSVRFDFSAPFFEHPDKVRYSFRLEGMNSKWSQWSDAKYQEFTNLPEGRYTFAVKALNIYGTESEVAVSDFVVLAPWYRTIAAYFIYIILAVSLLWLFARLYSLRLKRENIRLEGIISERTAEIVRQKDEIVNKNTVLEYQKKEIEDSIRYASRIQSAVIPSETVCREILPESFVFFRPLNIVSGDFYWIGKVDRKIIISAADCTGHGVPGAFMSMLGVAFLNEIVNKDNITSPDRILNSLRDKVIKALQQQGASGETRDGMDIAIVTIDTQSGIMEYAGAYNPLIMIRNGEITDIPGDKMPIGFYENMNLFRKREIIIQKGDTFYMYSDGYEDQFGGPEGKKFKSKRLKNLLLEISRHPADEQKEILEKRFDEWKGDLPQVDDIVVVGITINQEITPSE